MRLWLWLKSRCAAWFGKDNEDWARLTLTNEECIRIARELELQRKAWDALFVRQCEMSDAEKETERMSTLGFLPGEYAIKD